MTLARQLRSSVTKPYRLTNAARLALLAQFLRFGAVGVIGFVIDTAMVYALRGRLGLYGAGMVAYFVAASATWALNRAWTFRGRGTGRAHRQWAMFLVANLGGLILNRGTYAALIATSSLCVSYPVLAVAAGAIAGMFANFAASRQLVFR
jgi:putative flippase GtrA